MVRAAADVVASHAWAHAGRVRPCSCLSRASAPPDVRSAAADGARQGFFYSLNAQAEARATLHWPTPTKNLHCGPSPPALC